MYVKALIGGRVIVVYTANNGSISAPAVLVAILLTKVILKRKVLIFLMLLLSPV